MAIHSSTFVEEKYETFEKLGEGSYAAVWKIRSAKSEYALKVFKKSVRNDLYQIAREAAILRRAAGHPHFVQIVDVMETDREVLLILEYLAGGDLKTYIQDNGPLRESTVRRWMAHLLKALSFLRQNGIVHRDLKTENLLLSERSDQAVLKMADFGLSSYETDVKKEGEGIVGSPIYAAPEILLDSDSRCNYKTDLWSVGLICFEMLTGRCLYEANDIFTLTRLVQDHVVTMETLPSSLSLAAKNFLTTVLQKDPQRRPDIASLSIHPFLLNNNNNNSDSILNDDAPFLKAYGPHIATTSCAKLLSVISRLWNSVPILRPAFDRVHHSHPTFRQG